MCVINMVSCFLLFFYYYYYGEHIRCLQAVQIKRHRTKSYCFSFVRFNFDVSAFAIFLWSDSEPEVLCKPLHLILSSRALNKILQCVKKSLKSQHSDSHYGLSSQQYMKRPSRVYPCA